jgi:acetyl esterase/lipase
MPIDRAINLWPDASEYNIVPKDDAKTPAAAWAMPRRRPSVELYKPAPRERYGKNKRACVLVCPGGGYGALARHEGEPLAELFTSHGLLSGVIFSRVAPFKFPAPYSDATRAVRLIRSQADALDIDPSRIAIMGFSAGGHLASTVAIQPDLYAEPQDDLVGKVSARPDRVILGYPVVSMVTQYHAGSAANLLGPEPSLEQRTRFSNELHVSKNSPPAFIFHTADDMGVRVENALMLASAYAREGASCELHSYRSGPHGVGMAINYPALASWTSLLIDWLAGWIDGR